LNPNGRVLSSGCSIFRGTVLASFSRKQRGFTLLELLVVLAILALLTYWAGTDLSGLMGRYRLNAAARELASEVEACRIRAISQNREYALVLVDSDPDPGNGNGDSNLGRYEIRVGDTMNSSLSWETVPEGVYDLHAGPNAHSGISIEPWSFLFGVSGYNLSNSIIFSPRGYLMNHPSDFTGGVIRIVLRNKTAPFPERRVVRINRGGGAQIAVAQ